jgi:hypothetical protein
LIASKQEATVSIRRRGSANFDRSPHRRQSADESDHRCLEIQGAIKGRTDDNHLSAAYSSAAA